MDEPCSALDPIATRRIEELMVELKQNYTIAIVTHNMQQAQRVADTTAFFSVDISQGSRTGYLVESGPTKQIFESPREQLTKEYVSGPVQLSHGVGRRRGLALAAADCVAALATAPAVGARSSPRRPRSCCAAPAPPSPRRSTRSGSRPIGRRTRTSSITYEAVGSGEGQRRFLADAVDFGASDAALSDEQMARVQAGARLVPDHRRHRRARLQHARAGPARSSSAATSTWTSSPAASGRGTTRGSGAVNPGLICPNRTIALVARQDGSGTTFALTNHLSAISEAWRDRGPGVGNLVDWRGMAMLARGNEGVAGRIKGSEDSIGYVEYHFAKRLGLPMAHLQNQAGRYVEPGERSGQMALAAERQADAGQPPALPARSRRRGVLSDRHLQLAPALRPLPGPRQGGGAEEVRRVGPHRRAVASAAISATSRCRPRSPPCPSPRWTASTDQSFCPGCGAPEPGRGRSVAPLGSERIRGAQPAPGRAS